MTNIEVLCENAGDALGQWNTLYPQLSGANFVQTQIQPYLPLSFDELNEIVLETLSLV